MLSNLQQDRSYSLAANGSSKDTHLVSTSSKPTIPDTGWHSSP